MDEQSIQEHIQKFWTENKIHERSVSRNRCYPKVTIYDGPPFPTGPPHHGHMMTSAVKDTVARYLMATGHYVPRQLGWDMYGPNNPLPEKTEGHIKCWNQTLSLLGRWVEGEGYRTSCAEYRESVWWVFKSLWNKGHLRIGYGITPYCQPCDLYYSDFERYQQYCGVKEHTIYYSVPTKATELNSRIKAILVWEMWPWTLMAVTGYAMGCSDYVIDQHGTLMSKHYAWTNSMFSVTPITGSFEGLEALNPVTDQYVPIITSSKVASNKGTGIVRLAPLMDARSRSIIDVGVANMVPELVTTKYIIQLLETKGMLRGHRTIERNDSACPKCNGRLITYPCHGIYYNIHDNRTAIQKTLETIYWEPKSSKERIIQYLSNANDWLVSRSTRVGTAIPVWISKSGKCLVIGSYAELKEYGIDPELVNGQSTSTISYQGIKYQRLCYQFDNWFDSACMPYGSVGYPFRTTKMELVDSLFPCLLAIEGVDQVYGWFFTANVISNSLFGGPAFKNIITNGLVLNEGIKMSKSKPRSDSVQSDIEKYGADTYRVNLMQNRLLSGIDFNYDSNKINSHFTRGILGAFSLILKYCSSVSAVVNIKFKPTRITNITDNWILQAMDDYLEQYHALMSVFKVARTLSLSATFLTHIKKYIYYNRNRLATDETISVSVIVRVYYYYLMTVAPFVPHITEYIYQELRGYGWIPDGMSIHLCQIPCKQWRINKGFLKSSDLMFRIIDLVNKTPVDSTRIRVHLHDVTIVRGVDGYIREVTGKDIVYCNGLSKVMKASIKIQDHKVFNEQDRELFENMSMEQIAEVEDKGYYRCVYGNRVYPGQYAIKHEPRINVPRNYCGCGVLIQVVDREITSPSESLIDSKDVILKGQIIGRRLNRLIKKFGRCIVYFEHPSLTEMADERLRVLVSNINRYTLPIINQSIYQYREDCSSAFDILEIKMFAATLTFYLVSVDKGQTQTEP
jgi:isoleucyl-tRNA synthetase